MTTIVATKDMLISDTMATLTVDDVNKPSLFGVNKIRSLTEDKAYKKEKLLAVAFAGDLDKAEGLLNQISFNSPEDVRTYMVNNFLRQLNPVDLQLFFLTEKDCYMLSWRESEGTYNLTEHVASENRMNMIIGGSGGDKADKIYDLYGSEAITKYKPLDFAVAISRLDSMSNTQMKYYRKGNKYIRDYTSDAAFNLSYNNGEK